MRVLQLLKALAILFVVLLQYFIVIVNLDRIKLFNKFVSFNFKLPKNKIQLNDMEVQYKPSHRVRRRNQYGFPNFRKRDIY